MIRDAVVVLRGPEGTRMKRCGYRPDVGKISCGAARGVNAAAAGRFLRTWLTSPMAVTANSASAPPHCFGSGLPSGPRAPRLADYQRRQPTPRQP